MNVSEWNVKTKILLIVTNKNSIKDLLAEKERERERDGERQPVKSEAKILV